MLLGSLQNAAVCLRSDVSTTLSILGFAQARPTQVHLHVREKVARYIKGTINLRMAMGGGTDHSLQLMGFADANWENDSNTRKCRSG
jgi:hypothetical protein